MNLDPETQEDELAQGQELPPAPLQPSAPRVTRGMNLAPDAKRYLMGSAIMGISFTFPFTLLAIYLDKLGFDKVEVGLIASGQPWGQVLAAAPAAVLLTRFSTRNVLTISAVASGLLYSMLPWMPNQGLLFAVNLGAGFAWALHSTAGAPFLFRQSNQAGRPLLFSVAESSRMLASVFGAIFAGWLAATLSGVIGDDIRGHRWALCAAGMFPALASFVYFRIEEGPRSIAERKPLLPALRKHRNIVMRFAAPQLLISLGSGMTIPFMSLYFTERFGFASQEVGYLFGGGQVLMALGFLSGPFLMASVGPVRAMMAVQLASIPFFFTLAGAEVAWIAAGAYLLRTAFMNASHPVLKTFMMEATPPSLREFQNAMLLSLWGIGWVAGPLIGGYVLESTGNNYAYLMYTTIVFYLIASVTMHFTLRPVEKNLDSLRDVD